MNFDENTINKSNVALNYGSCVTKIRRFSIVGHRISSTMAKLMQDAIKMPSSFIAFDAPPNSLIDSTMSPKVKTSEG